MLQNSRLCILVVGAGAVGMYYGSRLQLLGHQVQYLARGNASVLRDSGLVVRSLNNAPGCPSDSWNCQKLDVVSDASAARPADLVLVTVKAFDNEAIRRRAAALVKEGGKLLLLQNGLGEEEEYRRLLRPDQIFSGLCFIGASFLRPGELVYTGNTSIWIACYAEQAGKKDPSPAVLELAEEFEKSGVRTESHPDHQLVRWRKLVWNIPFNGLCVVLGTNTGELLRDPSGLSMVRLLMSEVIAGAQACGREIPADFADKMISDSLPLGDYEPSMVRDFKSGRPLEVDAIYSRPIAIAAAGGCRMAAVELLDRELRHRIFLRDARLPAAGQEIS